MRIMKFGGTSVRDPVRVSAGGELVAQARREVPVAVVVSALGGITDQLQDTAAASAAGESVFAASCKAMRERHLEVAKSVARDTTDRERLRTVIEERLSDLEKILEGVYLVRECSPRTLDKVLSVGELLSSELMAAALRSQGLEAEACDARTLIVTDRSFGSGRVESEITYERIRRHFAECEAIQVVTGFLAASREGETTTLGRGGSDYSASLVGAALDADRIEIWTDVDGVLSADPQHVPGAFSLLRLSYDELLELSHFGAKVVYPPTVHPARSKSIPLIIKNTLNPGFRGTLVHDEADTAAEHPIRGISAIPRVALLRLQGDGMSEVPGTARRLFRVLAQADINVIFISQASSEHSICLAVQPVRAAEARDSIHTEFFWERGQGLIDDLVVDEDLSVVAVVGAGMNQRPGISGRLFGALGEAGINVRAIAQGSSELNISFAIASRDEKRVLRTLHAAFFEEPPVHLFLAGVGGVGTALLEQLRSTDTPSNWSLSGISNSRRMSLDRERADSTLWEKSLLDDDARNADLEIWRDYIVESPGQRVLVDCTASDSLEQIYPALLRRGVSIVTANKKPMASSREMWDELRTAQEIGTGRVFFEATVGAGLPVIRTLQDQIQTGDQVHRIEGLFSGTLGYLMSEMRAGRRFSEVVKEAHERGFTEPDPRQDLSGTDVARKLLILARLAGASIRLEDIEVESLLPTAEWDELGIDDFWRRLPELDEIFADKLEKAKSSNRILTYLARWENQSGRVSLELIDRSHPCSQVEGTDNLFVFTSERYGDRPMLVSGPGAGPQVTAAGVYSDLLRALAEGRGK